MSLPKFLLCDDGGARAFVLHCEFPRMLIEFRGNRGEVVMVIDPDSAVISTELEAGREPGLLMARLLREAGDFYVEQLQNEFDDDE